MSYNAIVVIDKENGVLSRIQEQNQNDYNLGCYLPQVKRLCPSWDKYGPCAIEDLLDVDIYFHLQQLKTIGKLFRVSKIFQMPSI